ncbi:hypothetical protein HPB50_006760 [Hyalomma asiaticum]|uniref:Uncharacterized protein n=1 Tax=Hyalomma asiaticum TaxID=266040 RepID=A0ACB7SLE6_HYAAI|nr:hypothetical protein HPB50_006760 [Hyalomma asiaticum]
MGAPQHRLLCAWHVDKNWRESLSKYIQDKTLKAFTYKELRTVLAVPDELSLHEAIEHFIDWCEREDNELRRNMCKHIHAVSIYKDTDTCELHQDEVDDAKDAEPMPQISLRRCRRRLKPKQQLSLYKTVRHCRPLAATQQLAMAAL